VVTDGFQSIGLTCVVLAPALGAERVDVLGLHAPLAQKARNLGASILDSASDISPHEYPITIDGSLDPELLASTLRATAPGGTCTISAMYAKRLTPIPLYQLFAACATVRTGQPHVRADLKTSSPCSPTRVCTPMP
jgi:threonine dehydrogenase-like Zn-dependent dehydrogenase